MDELSYSLLAWYDRCARNLPWRGFHDAYRTWISEAMLQQTRVETVLSYYPRFLELFPTLSALAQASESEVLKAWEGLGYYSRARNLWKGARQVITDFGGVIPRDPSLLQKISGIGQYTAGAIASIAYDVPVPAVDGNVIRVVSRLYGIRSNATEADTLRRIRKLAASLVPEERPGDYNQAVMDLGATVCIPGTPDCGRCPLTSFCNAFQKGDAPDLPVLPKSKPQKNISYVLLLVLRDDCVLIRRRTERLLHGLWCFPMFEGELSAAEIHSQAEKKLHLSIHSLHDSGFARHVFTHRIWNMRIYKADTETSVSVSPEFCFVPVNQLKDYAFPVAMNAALRILTRQS